MNVRWHAFLFSVFAGAVILLSGCGSILIRPAVDNVKTVALVSVYMNRDFYDVAAPRASEGTLALKTLGRAVLKGTKVMDKLDNAFGKEFQQIMAYSVKKYSEQLDGVGSWRWMPVSSVITNKDYINFIDTVARQHQAGNLVKVGAALASADYVTAPHMIHIPMERLAQNGVHVYAGDAKDPKQDMRKMLAQLCKKLNVDAVAVLELDMGYKKPMIALSLGVDSPAAANISSALVLVNRDGELAVNTGLIEKGKGTRYEGKTAGLLRAGFVHFTDKAVESYCQAIEKSAADMRKKLDTAFSKLK